MVRLYPSEQLGQLFGVSEGLDALSLWDAISRFVRKYGVFFALDDGSQERGLYAKTAVESMLDDKGLVFYVIDQFAWPIGQVPALFNRIRSCQHGYVVNPSQAEFIEQTDGDYCLCLTACAMWNLWGFAMIRPEDEIVLYVDDDEWLGIASKDIVMRNYCARHFRALGLVELSESELL